MLHVVGIYTISITKIHGTMNIKKGIFLFPKVCSPLPIEWLRD